MIVNNLFEHFKKVLKTEINLYFNLFLLHSSYLVFQHLVELFSSQCINLVVNLCFYLLICILTTYFLTIFSI